MVLTDIENRFVQANGAFARLFGHSREELATMSMADITHPEHLDESLAKRESLMAGSSSHFEMEKRYRRKDGAIIWGLTNVSLVRDPDGRPVQYVGQVQDITVRKEAEERIRRLNEELEDRVAERTAQLEAANKELEAFSYSVSHDLRAPLRAIDGFSRILATDHGPQLPAPARELLDDVRRGARQMGRLVDDLLAFSRLGRRSVSRQHVETADLVRECLAELRPAWAGRSVDFRLEELPACQADPALLKQVWMNLLANALKYSGKRERATIEIGFDGGADAATYFVRDNGVGFDMRYVHKLFGVFQRLHRSEDYEGTGVGLAIVQRIVQRHGGRVWADSRPDCGATFSFTIPATGGSHHG